MYFISSSVAAGESRNSLCCSNQKAWQAGHTSIVIAPPMRAPSVHSFIAAPQFEHFTALWYQVVFDQNAQKRTKGLMGWGVPRAVRKFQAKNKYEARFRRSSVRRCSVACEVPAAQ